MGLFDKLNNPVFLKEESSSFQYLVKLKELQSKASGKAKDIIDKEIKLTSFGIAGENNVAFELKNSCMPMYILHDIHYDINGLSAQIDFLVVTRKITFVIECKNLFGNIDIDNSGNFKRSYVLNGRYIKEGIYSPITQNQRHMEILKQIRRESRNNFITKMLFDKYFYENYKSIVVLANPKTILNAKYAGKEIRQMVIKADQLNNYIKMTNEQSGQPNENDKYMKNLAEWFLSMDKPDKSDYIKKYDNILNMIDLNLIKEDNKEYNINPVSDNEIKSDNRNEELIKELKAFRLERSRQEDIKPYYIFSDDQMMHLIDMMPGTKYDLLKVSGFGKIKTEKYGDRILKILNDFK